MGSNSIDRTCFKPCIRRTTSGQSFVSGRKRNIALRKLYIIKLFGAVINIYSYYNNNKKIYFFLLFLKFYF